MNLREYHRKRDFSKTAEPAPKETIGTKKSHPEALFVIQKHAASHLHFDFRLEMEGVLKSWAVPKGIPLRKGEKHLAVQVEDHPFEYARFEGIIPKGQYGGGTVMVWDLGTYSVSGEAPVAALKSGKLHLCLKGKKLRGEWTLVRTGAAEETEKQTWLLMKTGESVPPLSRQKEDESAISGRKMRQIEAARDATWESKSLITPRVRTTGAGPDAGRSKAEAPAFVQPMKPKLVKTVPKEKGWIFELKFDGFRAIALKHPGNVALYSRNQKVLKFPEVAEAIGQIQCQSAVLDGEIVALDEEGRPSFQLLQSPDPETTCYYLFDLLNVDGKNLMDQPLSARKKRLASLIPKQNSLLLFSGDLPGAPDEMLTQIKSRGLEGIVAKRINSRYEPGQRTGAWIKVKCINEQEFVIGGVTLPKGSRSHFGSVLVGYYQKGRLLFAGKVGTGFSEQLLRKLMRDFKSLRIDACPFVDLPAPRGDFNQGLSAAEMKRCTWLKPERVCQVKFTEWTRDGKLRQPVFLGIREDSIAAEVHRERP